MSPDVEGDPDIRVVTHLRAAGRLHLLEAMTLRISRSTRMSVATLAVTSALTPQSRGGPCTRRRTHSDTGGVSQPEVSGPPLSHSQPAAANAGFRSIAPHVPRPTRLGLVFRGEDHPAAVSLLKTADADAEEEDKGPR